MTSPQVERFVSRRINQMSTNVPLQLRPPFPQNIMVELSNGCNHKCVFCSNPKMTRSVRKIDRKLLCRIMKDAYTLGAREIGFYTTGDPFVHRNLPLFVQFAKDSGFAYTYISTNGALANRDRIDAVIAAGIDSIKFSINASDRSTYKKIHGYDDWDTVMSNLKYCSNLRAALPRELKLAISYVVTNQNRSGIRDFYRTMIPYVDEICFSDCSIQGGNMLENEGLLTSRVVPNRYRSPCHMLFNRAHITCEGYLTLCCVDYQNYLAICDLRETTLAEAWKDPLFQTMRRRHLQHDLKGTLCYNCINSIESEVSPLRKDLATSVDFRLQSRRNEERQRARLS